MERMAFSLSLTLQSQQHQPISCWLIPVKPPLPLFLLIFSFRLCGKVCSGATVQTLCCPLEFSTPTLANNPVHEARFVICCCLFGLQMCFALGGQRIRVPMPMQYKQTVSELGQFTLILIFYIPFTLNHSVQDGVCLKHDYLR